MTSPVSVPGRLRPTNSHSQPVSRANAGLGLANAHGHNREQKEKFCRSDAQSGAGGELALTSATRRTTPTLALQAEKSPTEKRLGFG
jgi:hypothetical protein